jgi:hypothetical protein
MWWKRKRSKATTCFGSFTRWNDRPHCGVCKPKISRFHFCRHLVDPESRLYLLLTKAKNWDHFKTMEALDAYADFLTLKVLEKDYDDSLLEPTNTIDEVSADLARRNPPL